MPLRKKIFLLFIVFPFLLIAQENSKPPLTLAKNWDGQKDLTGWWMSEKLDGVRAYWNGEKLLSRSGKEFFPPKWFLKNLPKFSLDGELWSSRGHFEEIISTVRRNKPHDGWKKIKYMIFDVPGSKLTFEERIKKAKSWFQKHQNEQVEFVEQIKIMNQAQLLDSLRIIENGGGEGMMVRKPNSLYEAGRTNDLLKVKTYHDMEGKVLSYKMGQGRFKGVMGSLLIQIENGVKFYLGTGFSLKERSNPPPIGSSITFRYKGFTKNGKPKFASFVRIKKKL